MEWSNKREKTQDLIRKDGKFRLILWVRCEPSRALSRGLTRSGTDLPRIPVAALCRLDGRVGH